MRRRSSVLILAQKFFLKESIKLSKNEVGILSSQNYGVKEHLKMQEIKPRRDKKNENANICNVMFVKEQRRSDVIFNIKR